MNLVEFTDAREFHDQVWAMLIEREAENNLMIGIVGQLAEGADAAAVGGASPPRFWAVQDEGTAVAAAAITPPHRLILTRMTPQTVDFVATELRRQGISLPGVVGPKETAGFFAGQWSQRSSCRVRLGHAMRIYQLDRVTPPAGVSGRMAIATLDDFALVQEWNLSFSSDVGAHIPMAPDRLRQRIRDGRIFVWCDPDPVSIALVTGPTPNGIRIGMVYTPPAHRCKGYASALVAAVSQRMLDSGRTFCFLFADLANPISNSIYQKIGYRPVCDFAEYDFTEGERER